MKNDIKTYETPKQSKKNKPYSKKRNQERKMGERSVLKKYSLQDIHSDECCFVLHPASAAAEKRLPFNL